jgi:PHD/YefM family antitoxin component YafN of YafNO toxin-antitoxin module/plasmid stabilization system protein ParE
MPQIRPITDLRNTNEISDLCHAKNEPIFITKNGYGDLVVMSVEAYEAMLDENELDREIAQAEAEYRLDEKLHDARKVLGTLRRKHFGQVQRKLLPAAYRNLDDIYAYIATQLHAEQSALNLIDKLEEAIFSLQVMPQRGAKRRVGAYANKGYRFFLPYTSYTKLKCFSNQYGCIKPKT